MIDEIQSMKHTTTYVTDRVQIAGNFRIVDSLVDLGNRLPLSRPIYRYRHWARRAMWSREILSDLRGSPFPAKSSIGTNYGSRSGRMDNLAL